MKRDGGRGRRVENESEGWGSEDGNETGSGMEEGKN